MMCMIKKARDDADTSSRAFFMPFSDCFGAGGAAAVDALVEVLGGHEEDWDHEEEGEGAEEQSAYGAHAYGDVAVGADA